MILNAHELSELPAAKAKKFFEARKVYDVEDAKVFLVKISSQQIITITYHGRRVIKFSHLRLISKLISDTIWGERGEEENF